jgi:hypothetical protein
MTLYHWLSAALIIIALALVLTGGFVALQRRRRLQSPPSEGWLTDAMVRQIIEQGGLSDEQVPEEALDLEEIAKEEERFWSEKWDEPEHYWE